MKLGSSAAFSGLDGGFDARHGARPKEPAWAFLRFRSLRPASVETNATGPRRRRSTRWSTTTSRLCTPPSLWGSRARRRRRSCAANSTATSTAGCSAAGSSSTVLPPVPLRPLVLTLPLELRGRFGFDGKLPGAVSRLFVDSMHAWYRRRLRMSTRERAESGAVIVVQRASSDLKLNPHLHVVFLDGAYAATADGTPAHFRPPKWPMRSRSPAPASSATSRVEGASSPQGLDGRNL